jgi:hypothetical protein
MDILRKQGNLFGDLFRKPFIVIVQEGNPLSSSLAHADIPGLAASYRLLQFDHSQALFAQTFELAHCPRLRTIDNHYYFQIDISLVQYTANCAAN